MQTVSPAFRIMALAMTALLVAEPLGVVRAQDTQSEQTSEQNQELSKEKLEQLVAPIALYPDPLLSQVLMASTYPLEIVQAARWAQANPNVKGKALEDAMQSKPWDPSVKSLTAFPSTLQMMNDKLDWTQQLGDAFLAQQQDIMTAVQTLRERADKAGNLKSTKQQKVTKGSSDGQSYIEIESQDPNVVYVPAYDPNEVYGTWPYPSYPPYYWYPPGYVGGPGWWWGAGIIGGSILWGIANWGRHEINIDVDRYNRFNRTNISNGRWEHNVAHRKGVPYASQRLNDQFRPHQGNVKAAREEFRGRADTGRAALAGAAAGAAGGAVASKAAKAKVAAKAGPRPKATAFDRPGPGKSARSASARGRSSRAASVSRSGGFRGGSRGGGGGRRGGGRRSDIRAKHDIVLLGRLSNGMGLYRFAYNGSRKLYVGVIAQEAMKVAPQAVSRDQDGYLRVDYDQLGVPFQTYDHWLATGAGLPKPNPH